jgi:hypothetical protein
MRAHIAIVLIVLCLPALAADVVHEVPYKFLGDWCTQPQPGEEDTGESNIRIESHAIGYYRDGGRILAAAATDDQLTLIVQLREEDRTWLTTHEFELSQDGARLTSVGEIGRIMTRGRCQASLETPPNNSFKPKPLRGSA